MDESITDLDDLSDGSLLIFDPIRLEKLKSHYWRMHSKTLIQSFFPLIFFLIPFVLQAQYLESRAVPVPDVRLEHIPDFETYSTFQLDMATIAAHVRSDANFYRLSLELPGYGTFRMDLFENRILTDNFITTVMTGNGPVHFAGPRTVKAFRGSLDGGQYAVRLTIDDEFIYGYVELPKEDKLYIEPLYYHMPDAVPGVFIVYRASDITRISDVGCGVHDDHHLHHRLKEYADLPDALRMSSDCREVEIALADDWLMYQKYGQSIPNVENHNIGVLNNVQSNFDDEFQHELSFVITEIWISTCSTCDPWTSSTNPSALLNSFSNWGGNGFSNPHDVATLWTNRNLNGNVIGIAWVGGVCVNGHKYNVCQDFSSNQNLLRVLQAHELGHNFNALHDAQGSPWIMAPAVQNTDLWSQSSQNAINNYVNSINCLAQCGAAPVADFSSNVTSGCTPMTVNFSDMSSGAPTSWSWTFPGGIPGSSTAQNPVVTYHNPGSYDVILEVSNAIGSDVLVKSDYIEVHPLPVAAFDYIQDVLTVYFTNHSQFSNEFLWEFGDGQTSTSMHPVHTYPADGVYQVKLTASNGCGDAVATTSIQIVTPPTADFTYSITQGCEPLVVEFYNLSSNNAVFFEWYFPGAVPSFSVQENPVVTYYTPGTFSVTLIAYNSAGQDVFQANDLITVLPQPFAAFGTFIDDLVVQFTNSSQHTNDYLWTFGDGNSSSAQNPLHTYAGGGNYQVTLMASNSCGTSTATTTLNLQGGGPVAEFGQSGESGCVPFTVTFSSTFSGEVTSFAWSFPGGIPESSSEPMPEVVYNQYGVYDVQLIVTNTQGADTMLIEEAVVALPDVISGFESSVDGQFVSLLNTSTGANVFEWQIDGVLFFSENVDYTFPGDGYYEVVLIATGTCGTDTSMQILHIATAPEAGFMASVTQGCEPLTVEFYNTSSLNAHSFLWNFEGGIPSSSTLENPVVHYPQAGVYSVQLAVTSDGGSDMLVIYDFIVVDALPEASFATIQDGLEVEFINSSESVSEYQWVFGDGTVSTEQNPTHMYGDFGTYSVILIVSNDCGSDTLANEIMLTTAPIPLFIAEQAQGCAPFEVQFVDMSQNGVEEWDWSFPGGNPESSSEQHPHIIYTEPGVYTVTLIVSNSAGVNALVREEYILVGDVPVAGFEFFINEGIISFSSISVGATTYLWDFGDGTQDFAEHPIHTYENSGIYTVQLIAFNACGADTSTAEVQIMLTSVEDPLTHAVMQVYPNPNEGTFFVRVDGVTQDFDITVLDLLGKPLEKIFVQKNSAGTHLLTMRDLPQGVYMLVLGEGGLRRVARVVVL